MSNCLDNWHVRSEGGVGWVSLSGTAGLARGLGAGQAENEQRLTLFVAFPIEQAATLPFQDP